MRYRQDTRLKSDRKKTVTSQGNKVSEVVFDKEITQEWQVKTNEPTEILPYLLKRICLSRVCEFWHQMKFFYFENYEELTANQHEKQEWAKESNLLEDFEESVILVKITSERVEQSRKFLKTLWKITRQRLMKGMNRIKLYGGVEDESSLEEEDDKLNSYMRFLKLQENKRIDIAIETLDSVIEKNSKKKLLNGFLNIREKLKQEKKIELYRDKIRIECFVDIVMRSIKRENRSIVKSAFESVELRGEFMRRMKRHQTKSTELINYGQTGKKTTQNESNLQKEEEETVNKLKRKTETPVQSHEKEKTNQETIKRETIINNNTKSRDNQHNLRNDSEIKSISSHEQIIESQYYYDEASDRWEDEDKTSEKFEEIDENEQEMLRINNNSMPTRRAYHHQRHHAFNEEEVVNNNNEENFIHKKTARTPSRITQNFYQSQNLDSESQINMKQNARSQHQTHNKHQYQHDLHIPITQRIEKHFYEEHYEEEEEEEAQEKSLESNHENIHQQICVIRNASSTPQRKPDRYEKIPIVSNNIEFRQFFINSNKKEKKIEISTHSTTYFEKKCCEGCQYCSRLKKINEMMTFIQKDKKLISESEFHSIRAGNPSEKFIKSHTTVIETSELSKNNENIGEKREEIVTISKTEEINAFTKKTFENERKLDKEIKMESSKISNESKKELSKQESTTSRKGNYSKEEKPISALSALKDIGRSGFTPSRQSLMTKSTYSKGLSERKVFSRKPMH